MCVTIEASIMKTINFAACHCGLHIVEYVRITGGFGQDAVLCVRSVPEFLYEYKKKITLDPDGVEIEFPDIHVDAGFYRQELIEAREGMIQIELRDVDNLEKVLAFEYQQIHIQPYLQWDGSLYRETLSAFMQPNDPLVARVLNRAGEIANEAGGRMVGYQSESKEDVLEQAKYIYEALQEEKVHYICPPAGFEDSWGQKVRIPHHVLHEDVKQGTCLDLAVLYATCLEAASLHAVIFVIPGHAFAGLWVDPHARLSTYYCDNWEEVKKQQLRNKGDLVPVECTTFADSLEYPFENAVEAADQNVFAHFLFALDIQLGRQQGYVPAYTFTDQPICDSLTYGENEKTLEETIDMYPSNHCQTKLSRLIGQAMDFTLKNALLSKETLQAELAFSISAKKFFEKGYADEELFLAMRSMGIPKEKTDRQLYEFLCEDRRVRREYGQGALYLTINELVWYPKNQEKSCKAPIYLCPAEIYRNIRGDYLFRIKADEVFVNPVLKELLYQDFRIDLSDLRDHLGNEYSKQIGLLTYAVSGQKNWRIVENQAGLGIYHVPNEAIWRGLQDEKLKEHDIVRGILDGAMTWNNELSEANEEDPDKIYAFQADSSQSEVIRSVGRKRAQVVVGPAGNGKSQTIANIITEQMREGKRVLFVAEKLSAMEVVAALLDKAGLSPFCLMLPDSNHSLGEVKQKIESTLRFIADYHSNNCKSDKQEENYREAAEKLQQFYSFMKIPGECGQSLAELLEEYEQYRKLETELNWESVGKTLNHPDAEHIIISFEEAFRACGQIQMTYRPYIRLTDMTKEESRQAAKAVEETLAKLGTLKRQIRYFEQLVGISLENGCEKDEIRRIMIYGSALRKCPIIGKGLKPFLTEDTALANLLNMSRELMRSTPGSNRYDNMKERLWSQLDEIIENKDETELNPDGVGAAGWQIQDMYTGVLSNRQEKEAKIRFRQFCHELLKLAEGRDRDEQEALLIAAERIACGEGSELLEEAALLGKVYQEYMEILLRTSDLVLRNEQDFALLYPQETKAVLLQEWNRCKDKVTELSIYESVRKKAVAAGMGSLISQIEGKICQGSMTIDQIRLVFQKCRCEYNINCRLRSVPELRDFAYIDYKVYLKQYREKEQVLRGYLHQTILDHVISHMPDMKEGTADDRELGILKRSIRRGSSQTSIRSLFAGAPLAMQQLYPCMLMGPASVAEYIPADMPEFDLVIFDEGSQLPTYKALIPISRGKNCMIIGDEKQLTPTAFFQKKTENEDGAETPTEAILEDAIVTSMPQHMLKYHYRSRYESLVAFSNSRYYHNELITFPEPDTEIHGVQYILVQDGCYDRGGERNNRKEGERVVTLIREIFADLPENTTQTLGVITFNLPQMKLIRSLIRDAVLAGEPQSRQMAELVDVVNLETCQGKEWDITILSMTYGKDAEGSFSTNLGPLGRDDGGNRLNVMITRSRKRLYVVTSMTPEMFEGELKGGIQDVRDFLAYARGDLRLDTRTAGKIGEQSGILAAVTTMLEEKGYIVHTNIGSSFCKVDIGVITGEDDTYQLGILLDHFSQDNYYVRDDEVIKPAILESKGWKVYRLHAVNWYENAAYEMKQIEKLLAV